MRNYFCESPYGQAMAGVDKLKQVVASGSYRVSGRKREVLEAYLGTCVGLTLCDRTAGVGGLLHLLLAEPTFADPPEQPEIYATTGLPLFLQALLEAGAARNRLEACVAGGALIGPLTGLDFYLDIGGRTAEVVQEFLRRERIPVGLTETGGNFSCRLSLDLDTWESRIEPAAPRGPVPSGELVRPSPEAIARAIQSVHSIPQIALKIVRLFQAGEYNLADIAREVRQDQVLSARVIKLCNSAFFANRANIDSIDRALVLLGEHTVVHLVVSASVRRLLEESGQGYSLCKGGLFYHALGTAMLADAVARLTGRVSPDIAYTAGLLHDIGKVALDQYMTLAWPFFYRRTRLEGVELCAVEKETFGITHPEAGALLAEQWALPPNLADTIRHHHEPAMASVQPELTNLVYLADLLMSHFRSGQELERVDARHLGCSLKSMGLGPGDLPALVECLHRSALVADPPGSETATLEKSGAGGGF